MRSDRDRGDGTDVCDSDLRIREGIWGGGNLKIQPLGIGPVASKPRCMADLRLHPPFCQGFSRSERHDWD
jgi:hypothetical protein